MGTPFYIDGHTMTVRAVAAVAVMNEIVALPPPSDVKNNGPGCH